MLNNNNFTTGFMVEQSSQDIFNAVNNVRGWWSEEIKGSTSKIGGKFNYHFHDVNKCEFKVLESISGKKVVWQVVSSYFAFIKNPSEWVNTKLSFEIIKRGKRHQLRFIHYGLTPNLECFDVCRDGWINYINGSLFNLIQEGIGQPHIKNHQITESEKLFLSDRF